MSSAMHSATMAKTWAVSELCTILGESVDQNSIASIGHASGRAMDSFHVRSVCIDSRATGPGTLFVSLKGERADGHDFLDAVAKAGAVAALVSASRAAVDLAEWKKYAQDFGMLCIPVVDPLRALQDFAASWLRANPEVRTIGITGSTGKTTTKDLVRCVLSVRWSVSASPGNLNSVIGLPLAALAVPPKTDFAVFEMGMSEKGEMTRLAEIVLPAIAVVTNVGTAHIGNIGSQEGIAYEKKQIFSRFTAACTGLVPETDTWSSYLMSGVPGSFLQFGESVTPGYESAEPTADGQILRFQGESMNFALPGEHHRLDALAAIQIGDYLGMSPAEIRQGIESFVPGFGRSEILRGRITLVQDCYNANPDSMAASIRALMAMDTTGRRVLIVGDMGDLGEFSVALHASIGSLIAECGADSALFVGLEMKAAFEAVLDFEGKDGAGELHHAWFSTRDELAACIEDYIDDGDLVLLKASRSMEMERLTPVLMGDVPGVLHSVSEARSKE